MVILTVSEEVREVNSHSVCLTGKSDEAEFCKHYLSTRHVQDMVASTPADFAALELHFAPVDDDAVLTFEILGDASQRDVDSLKDVLLPKKPVYQTKLQKLWAYHPNRLG